MGISSIRTYSSHVLQALDLDACLQTRDTVKSELAALSARIAVLQSSNADNQLKRANILEAIESGGSKFPQLQARMDQLEQG
ncbi:hypothetical protein LJR034_009326 [Caballeronia sp. LjRoot34]|uniref:hypothetical protein n=1 Tax=Caballeronia sp. LjRoot34 TaxID=3342325 RepID=UPI003ECCCE12